MQDTGGFSRRSYPSFPNTLFTIVFGDVTSLPRPETGKIFYPEEKNPIHVFLREMIALKGPLFNQVTVQGSPIRKKRMGPALIHRIIPKLCNRLLNITQKTK